MISTTPLALFPLHTVLFPGGLLSLRVFEPRYLDLMTECLREGKPFGAIALQPSNVAEGTLRKQRLEKIGVQAELIDSDSSSQYPSLLQVRCRGLKRFEIASSFTQADGLQRSEVKLLESDDELAPAVEFLPTVRALANAIGALKNQGSEPFLAPYEFDKAGWVANRWCELLPISIEAKQRLMEISDASVRLKLVDEYLRSKGVI